MPVRRASLAPPGWRLHRRTEACGTSVNMHPMALILMGTRDARRLGVIQAARGGRPRNREARDGLRLSRGSSSDCGGGSASSAGRRPGGGAGAGPGNSADIAGVSLVQVPRAQRTRQLCRAGRACSRRSGGYANDRIDRRIRRFAGNFSVLHGSPALQYFLQGTLRSALAVASDE
mgnify:CR=1 FL=1